MYSKTVLIWKLCFKGANCFKAKVNIEVQWASEPVIAAIERNGGIITTAYYDMHCLHAMCNTEQFFNRGNFKETSFIPRKIILHIKCPKIFYT